MTAMTDTEDRRNVPVDELEAFRENLAEETKALADRLAEQAVGALKVPEEITPANEPMVIDFATQSKKLLREADGVRKIKKKPHDDRSGAVQDRFKEITGVLSRALAPVLQRHDAYVKAREAEERRKREEAARLAREEENRKRQEAEAKEREAAAKAKAAKTEADRRQAAADLQRAQKAADEAAEAKEATRQAERAKTESLAVEGDLGTTSFSAGRWAPVSIDMETVDLEALRPYLKPDHVEQAARAWIKAQGDEIAVNAGNLKGVVIERVSSTRYR